MNHAHTADGHNRFCTMAKVCRLTLARTIAMAARCLAASARVPPHAAQPAEHEPLTFLLLPDEIIVLVLCQLDARSLARVAATCSSLFCENTNPVKEALRKRSTARGRACPTHMPRGFSSSTAHLAWLEHRRDEAWAPVAAGPAHSFFATEGGQLISCGAEERHTEGVLGLGKLDGEFLVVTTPTPLPSMVGIRITSVSSMGGFNAAVSASGAIYTWGSGNWGRLGHGGEEGSVFPKQVRALAGHMVLSVATGVCHCLAVTEDGEVFSWGSASSGECGHGNAIGDQLLPRHVEALAGVRARNASAGWNHSLVVTEEGTLYSFGDGMSGQLGHGCFGDECTPKMVDALRSLRITTSATGYNHSLALTEDGTVFSWGENAHCQLGLGHSGGWETAPKRVEALDAYTVSVLTAGSDASCAVTAAGELFVMGNGLARQLGYDTAYQPAPRQVEALIGECVVAVAVGSRHTIAVTRRGCVYGWGDADALGLPANAYASMNAGIILSPCRYTQLSCGRST